jgi:hypothetical protein
MLHRPLVAILSTLGLGLLLALVPTQLTAQWVGDYQASGGLGVSFSPEREGAGVGGSFVLERAVGSAVWGGGRVYAGGFFSNASAHRCPTGIEPCSISSQIAVAGAKARLLAPIPYVGPFIEVGAGLSIGSLENRIGAHGRFSALDDIHSGVMVHIPVSLGLAFGSRHQHDLSLDYFAHPGRNHVTGSFSIGVGFALR